MIEILNEKKEKLEFESYESLFSYIKEQIKDQYPLEEGQEDWNFVVHSSERLSAVYYSAAKALGILLTSKEQEAYEKGLNLLEMHKGDSETPLQIVLTRDINVHEMKKSWCRDYCVEHGYTISESGRESKTIH